MIHKMGTLVISGEGKIRAEGWKFDAGSDPYVNAMKILEWGYDRILDAIAEQNRINNEILESERNG